jgi:Bifunctional DNA primase/polymerase, N-terminal
VTETIVEQIEVNRTLQIALDSLQRFPWLHLFPVEFDNKAQPLLKDYLNRASNDPAQIRRWHAYWKTRFNGAECWWGVAPALSGLIFADVDTKPGKRGQQTFELFELLHGWPQTMVTGSPSGGRHHWYRGRHLFALGSDRSNHPGIDFAQYVILPGCMKADGTGYTLQADHPIADAPGWFYVEAKRTAAKVEATEQKPIIELDQPANVEWAIYYLQHDAPRSVAGHGGEQTTLDVATVLKDYGIGEGTALELMAEFYNVDGRCDPIWSMDESPVEDSLPVKVRNAYAYKRRVAPGASSAEAEFADDDFEAEPLDKRTAAIVARQKLERAKAKADKVNGIRPKKPRRVDKKRRSALKRASAMAIPYRSESNG